MHKRLLGYLCDPVDGSPLGLSGTPSDGDHIESGELVSRSGHRYPITHGIPRFPSDKSLTQSVAAFGEEWNHFNYLHFRDHWKAHIADGVFGGTDYFAGKTIVDCAAGSGMHCRWMAEAGARHVIALELSDSVDGVMRENLRGLDNVDVVQCSIDAPPIRADSIDGLVICNAAIQHTPSVERTARALWRMVGPGGELAFSCYARFPNDPIWMARYWMIYRPLRAVLSRVSFETRFGYAKLMAQLRMLPVLGSLLEKANVLVRGDVPPGDRYAERLRAATVLNTFDWYGGHSYQHHLSANELATICRSLLPLPSKVQNLEAYKRRPVPPGMQIRLHAAPATLEA
jgi:ubiquinone/menaquinone biosynthesis C-methylase UbiE